MKQCRACKQEINEKRDRFVHLEDWNRSKLEEESDWHLNCFRKAMNRDLTLLEKQASEMLKRANTIYSNLPEEFTTPKKEFIL